jgi:HPt (histidine-containing phosphotransfer) domain-containing protein
MDDFISKPLELAELQRVLARFGNTHSQPGSLVTTHLSDDSQHLGGSAPEFDYEGALTQSDQEVVDIVADAFMAQWPIDVEKISQSLTRGDWSPLLHTAHALKSTLGMFGARPAVDLAQDLERLAASGSSGDTGQATNTTAAMAAKWAALQTQVAHLLAALRFRQG